MKRLYAKFFLAVAALTGGSAIVLGVVYGDWANFRLGVLGGCTFAALSLVAVAHHRMDELEERLRERFGSCVHAEHEREWVQEAAMFRCTGCGVGLSGPRP
jgi:hypothetical protein